MGDKLASLADSTAMEEFGLPTLKKLKVLKLARNQFSAPGLGLALVALFGGIPFLTTYLLYLSYQTKGDIRVMLLGEGRS